MAIIVHRGGRQTVIQTPTRTRTLDASNESNLRRAIESECKHVIGRAGFNKAEDRAGAVLASIKRSAAVGWSMAFSFAGYDEDSDARLGDRIALEYLQRQGFRDAVATKDCGCGGHGKETNDAPTLQQLYKQEDDQEAVVEQLRSSSVGNGDESQRATIKRKLDAAVEELQRIKKAVREAR